VFGLITSPAGTSYSSTLSSDSNTYAYVPAWEDVNVFDVRKGEKVGEWHVPGGREEVVRICAAPPSSSRRKGEADEESQDDDDEGDEAEKIFAVAYADGAIRIWSSSFPQVSSSEGYPNTAFELVTFNGHKKSPTALVFSIAGDLLFSGGVEGEIVVWDVLGEVGLFRLKGHRGGVTDLRYIPHPDSISTRTEGNKGFLISTSKDGMMKLWDLDSRHCLETVVVGRGEVTSLDLREQKGDNTGFEEIGDSVKSKGLWTILTGAGDGEVKVWELGYDELRAGIKQDDEGNVSFIQKPHEENSC
jgi:U3 small nucleolar RNA-associated protein 12